jgi:2'-5' RNA ligase
MADVTTALTLVAPQDFHDEINKIRRDYDRAYPRWMPHINFLFPFVSEDQFDTVVSKLEPALKPFGPFELQMSEIGFFTQGKTVTVHIKPKDDTKVKELFNIIRNVLPDIKSKHHEFAAHLTIAQFTKAEAPAKMEELKKWLGGGFTFDVGYICVLQRSKTDNNVPFSIHKKLYLSY